MSGYIYILTDGINTKIGITIDLDKRMSSYRTHNPNFQSFKTYPCNIEEAKRIEIVIKQMFKNKLSGSAKEWFAVQPEIINRYVSIMLEKVTESDITPAMHGVRLTNDAFELKAKILNALTRNKGHNGDAQTHKDTLSELFASRFGLGIPTHKLPEDIIVRDALGVDTQNCDKNSDLAIKGMRANYVQMPNEDHAENFYHLVRLMTGHHIAVCTARISMPYLERIDSKDKREEIISSAKQVGWNATFHNDWSWYYPDKSGLVLFEKMTPKHKLLREWDGSFRKWIIERSVILKQEKFPDSNNLEKAIDDVTWDSTFPLDIATYSELCEKYLNPFWGHAHDDDFFLKSAYVFLIQKWSNEKSATQLE